MLSTTHLLVEHSRARLRAPADRAADHDRTVCRVAKKLLRVQNNEEDFLADGRRQPRGRHFVLGVGGIVSNIAIWRICAT